MLSSMIHLVLLLSCRPGGRRKMLCCSFCSLLSRYWCCSLLMPYYFSLRLLGCGSQCSSCTPSGNHPLKGCRIPSVYHVLMPSFCCLRASLCLLLISVHSTVFCNDLLYCIPSVSLLPAGSSFRSQAVPSLSWLLLRVRYCCFLVLCRSLLCFRLLHSSSCCVLRRCLAAPP